VKITIVTDDDKYELLGYMYGKSRASSCNKQARGPMARGYHQVRCIMDQEFVCHYRGYGVYFDNGAATYWSIAGGNFQTLTEALQCIDRCFAIDQAYDLGY